LIENEGEALLDGWDNLSFEEVSLPMLLLKRCAAQFPALLLIALGISIASAQKAPIEITADLTDAPRKLFHADIDFPVSAGPLSLTSPEWIPGHHMPGGPAGVTSVAFTANGKTLEWRRDDVDMYEYHLTIPAGVTTLHARVESIATRRVSQRLAALGNRRTTESGRKVTPMTCISCRRRICSRTSLRIHGTVNTADRQGCISQTSRLRCMAHYSGFTKG